MKRIAIISSIFLLSMVISSCQKFLDTKPQDFLIPENFYETEEQLNMALAAVYSPLGEAALYGNRILRSGFDADDGFYDRSTDIFGVSSYNVSTADPNVRTWWATCYKGINRANLLLKNVNKPDMDDADRAVIEGETKFLRAYYYFLLVSNFGAVPLHLEPTENASATAIPRTPIRDVYNQIIADLEDAERKVKTAQALGFGGRVNKSAARGMLARVNLFMAGEPLKDASRYAEARKWAQRVIMDGGFHELNPDFRQVYINLAADLYDVKESLFEVEFYGNTQEVWREAGTFGTNFSPTYNNEGSSRNDPEHGYAYGFLNTTGVLWEKYDNPTSLVSNDLRRDWAIAPFTYGTGTPAPENPLPITQIYQRDAGKYRRVYERVYPKEKNYSPINFPVLRYADVLLMFAEADYFANNGIVSDSAKLAVNEVRRRGYGKYLNGRGSTSESISTIQITNGGTGYTTNPVITISGGGGEGATATAVRTGGVITAVNITNRGRKFTSPPTITVTGGGGSGAVLTPTLTTIDEADLTPTQLANFFQTIQDERSRELCFEALRKGDLVRWGLLVTNMKIVYGHILDAGTPVKHALFSYENVGPRDVVWPIPAYDMGLNPALVQNTGW